jgi:hypothetical protein
MLDRQTMCGRLSADRVQVWIGFLAGSPNGMRSEYTLALKDGKWSVESVGKVVKS